MNRLLWAGLLGTLGLTAWVALAPEDQTALPTAGAERAPTPPRATTTMALPPGNGTAPDALTWPGRLTPAERPAWAALPAKRFTGWAPPAPPPPPPPAPAPPPPPPKAPELGYQIIGSLEEGGAMQLILANTVRTLVVKKGEVIDGQWRVENISPTQITLLWLPGQLPRTLSHRSP